MAGLGLPGGIAEKLAPTVPFPVLMRVILPGVLSALLIYSYFGLYPFAGVRAANPSGSKFGISELETHWPYLVLFVLFALTVGAVVALLNRKLYEIYEGRLHWPSRIRQRALSRQQKRVQRMLAEQEKAETTRYKEIWYVLRAYPLNAAGSPEAWYPTELGNLLAAYEQYPLNRYGMDSVFYWGRLWLGMDREKKEEIDRSWCVADGLLSLSAVGYAGGALWVIAAASNLLGPAGFRLPLPPLSTFAAGLVVFFILGYGFYRLSLPYHRANGEIYKSLFDLYREKIAASLALKPDEYDYWQQIWAYLQYLVIPCPKCGTLNSSSLTHCNTCKTDLSRTLQDFRAKGRRMT